MKSLIYAVIYTCLAIPLALYAQDAAPSERIYEGMIMQLSAKQRKLDSLQSVYHNRVEQVEQLKKRGGNDDAVQKLTAASVMQANEIDVLQNEIKKQANRIIPVRDKLKNEYQEIIGQMQKERKTASSAQSASIDEKLLILTAKKIALYSPDMQFTFDPEKLLLLDITKIQNPAQRKLYEDRFSSAMEEVNRLLGAVGESVGELQKVVKLQKKAKSFLDDKEFTSSLNYSFNGRNVNVDKGEYFATTTGTTNDVGTRLVGNATVYNAMLLQLSFIPEVRSYLKERKEQVERGGKADMQTYLQTLRELQTALEEFQELLKQKTETRK